jgi:spore germination cell wall hydrolase CwlJ-like protein
MFALVARDTKSLLRYTKSRWRALALCLAWISLSSIGFSVVVARAAAGVAEAANRDAAKTQQVQVPIGQAMTQLAVLRARSAAEANAARPNRDLDCMAAAIYYEARGESAAGQAAVAQVVLNRVRNPTFPKTVCGVVYQGVGRKGCQFSFACHRPSGRPEGAAWAKAKVVAARALAGHVMSGIGSATYFHLASLGPIWGDAMIQTAQVGQHIFYRPSRRHPQHSAPPAPTGSDDTAPAVAAPVPGTTTLADASTSS